MAGAALLICSEMLLIPCVKFSMARTSKVLRLNPVCSPNIPGLWAQVSCLGPENNLTRFLSDALQVPEGGGHVSTESSNLVSRQVATSCPLQSRDDKTAEGCRREKAVAP